MIRLSVITSVLALALVACGAQDAQETETSGEAPPPVSAEANAPALEVEIDEVIVVEDAIAPEVTSCLSLVKQGEFTQAVDICAAALGIDPDNSEVTAALEQARNETAKQAATDAATGSLQDATGGLTQ